MESDPSLESGSAGIESGAVLGDWGEDRFLEWVREVAGGAGENVVVSIGDDAAVLRMAGGEAVVTTDALIEDVHFRRAWTPSRDLGAKSLAANLSDLAAMAARPVAAFLSLGVPPSTRLDDLRDFFLGLVEEGRRYGCPLAGGDLVRAPVWTIGVTVVGEPAAPGRVALRSNARPGDGLYATGWPGESAAGLEAMRRSDGLAVPRLVARHNRPTPRLAEAAALAGAGRRLAMADVSDGLLVDARRLARASGVRIELHAASLPRSPDLIAYAGAIDANPLDWILFGGEDYELVFATDAPEAELRAALLEGGIVTPLARIGAVLPGDAGASADPVRVIDPDGVELRLADRSFRHFA